MNTVSWRKKYDQGLIARRLESIANRKGSKLVSFNGFEFNEYVTVLYSMLEFPNSVSEIQARNMVHDAIFRVGGEPTITADGIKDALECLIREYLSQPYERYVLITSVSLLQNAVIPRIRINNVTIIFESSLPTRYHKERLMVSERFKYSLFVDPPTDYLSVRIHIAARSASDAVEKALDILDLVRGTWNLFYNRANTSRISSGKPKPVNKVVLGPVHTLHYPNGKLVSEKTFWYEHRYYGAVKPYDPSDKIEDMNTFRRNVRNSLAKKKSAYCAELERAIIQYSRALDDRDWYNAFLRLWVVLESLTNIQYGSYEPIIKRVSFLFEDSDYCKQVLKHLIDGRNKIVHESAEHTAIEAYLYQLKRFIDKLLMFHLSHEFRSLGEACQFLDLPTDGDVLKSQIEARRYAKKYLHLEE